MDLVFSISNFFINEIAPANIWMSFSCSNLDLVRSYRDLVMFAIWFFCIKIVKTCNFYANDESSPKEIRIFTTKSLSTTTCMLSYYLPCNIGVRPMYICYIFFSLLCRTLRLLTPPNTEFKFWQTISFLFYFIATVFAQLQKHWISYILRRPQNFAKSSP